jgi:hypothetical protein
LVGLLVVGSVVSVAEAADRYAFTLLADHSEATVNLYGTAALTGTWRGDYDQTSKPEGTRTIEGLLFGDTKAPNNNPIDFSASVAASVGSTTHPTGAFSASVNPELGVIVVNDLAADAMNGGAIDLNLALNLAWESFRTFSPTAYYLGGINLPLPLGAASLTKLSLAQATVDGVGVPGVGVLTEVGANTYDFTVGVAVNLTVEASLNGSSIGEVSVPFPVVLEGTLFVDPQTRSATLVSFTLAQFSDAVAADLELPADLPLAIPTILPPGQTANLLASPVFNGVSLDLLSGMTLVAWGRRQCACDLNGDGQVDLVDYFLFFGAFDVSGPVADINGDGSVSLEDFFAFFEGLDRGCE